MLTNCAVPLKLFIRVCCTRNTGVSCFTRASSKMSTCSAAEIAEKKRLALEKLRAKKAQLADGAVGAQIPKPPLNGTRPVPLVQAMKPPVPKSPVVSAQPIKPPATKSPVSNEPRPTPPGTTKSPNNFLQKQVTSFYKQSTNNAPKPAAPNGVQNKASTFLNALKQSSVFSHRQEARNALHPYQRPAAQTTPQSTASAPKTVAPVFVKSVSCKVYMINAHRFAVHPFGYHAKLIEVLKGIPSKSYDTKTRIWDFALNDYQLLQQRMGDLKPDMVIGVIPKTVINLCLAPPKEINRSCLASIEPTLADKLLPFQQEGVCFAIAQHGRVMICDEMGLGKTYQALAIADFYKDDWPLLICTTASTRESWASHVRELLPSIPLHYIQVLTNQQQFIGDAKVLITSYNMMERAMSKLNERKFGFLIFDESHMLKNNKAKCTVVADRLAMMAKHVLLLSGTPALSRPLELFTQLQMIDRKFMNFIDFTSRYCDGKQTHFGWDATGQSNLQELNVVLKLKYMVRRVKADVLPDLSEKSRETVVLDPALLWPSDDSKEYLNMFAKNLTASKGKEKEEILLKFYAETAKVKTRAVCSYLKTLLKDNIKFIVFAHHRVMLDAITDCLIQSKVEFMRIDGSTKNETRSENINNFQKNPSCKVAVLSLKACNSGITLTAAEMIIFAELDWNPSTLAQAESRAHRIGQEKPITCRYLMATKTADDVIWNMLKAKQDVLNRAGLFTEDLQDASHTAAPTMSNKIEQYFVPDENRTETPKKHEQSSEKPNTIDFNKELKGLDELFEGDDDDFKDLKF